MKSKKPKKNERKLLIKKLDKVFSVIIRKRMICERCGKFTNLQCSHIHSREKMSVRWDKINAFCLCAGCHLYWWHKHPIQAAIFTLSKLGQEEYDDLNYRAETLKQWTIDELQFLYDEYRKEIKDDS